MRPEVDAPRDAVGSLPATGGELNRLMLILQSTSVGGMESHCVDLAAEFVRRDVEVMTIVPEAAIFDELAARFDRCGASVWRLDTDGRRGRVVQVGRWITLACACLRWRPDVVHVHTGGATGGLAPVLTARWVGRARTVITEHDVPGEAAGLHQRTTRWMMDRHADAIIAVSRRNARLRAERISTPQHKLAAVLNGVPIAAVSTPDRQRNRLSVRAELGIGRNEVVIGCLVRLAEGKGLQDLLRAFAISRRHAAGKLLLIGDGPLRKDLEALAAVLGLGGDIVFAGHRREPAPFLDAMDAFALAVPAGSMSIALLEAMARGLPSVITFCGPEEPVIDGETGLCAPPSDPGGLAVALTRFLSDPELRSRLGRNAADYTRSRFSVQRVVDDLVALYSECRTSVPTTLMAIEPVESVGSGRARQSGSSPV